MRNPRGPLWVVVGLLALAAAVFVVSLLVGAGGEFEGADGQAEDAISEENPDYEPWFSPLFEPSSGEIESGLFALQAGVGGLVVGYGLGVLRTRHRQRQESGATAGVAGASRTTDPDGGVFPSAAESASG